MYSHDPNQYPHAGVTQKEKILRDVQMINYFINHDKWDLIRNWDIIDCHRFTDDFCHEIDADIVWNISRAGAETYACQDMANGVIALVTTGDDDSRIELTQENECWKLVDCYPLYAEIRFKCTDIDTMVFWFGLIDAASWITGTHPDNYAVFMRASAAADIEFLTRSLAAAYANYGPPIDTGIDQVAATWYRLGIHWDGDGTIRWFVIQDGDPQQTILATGSRTTYIPQTVELTLGFGIMALEADAKDMYVDYVKCAQHRVIE